MIGKTLGHYEITSLLGKGGMGEVYRAHDPRVGRDVAVKIASERFTDRFAREIHAVAALNHPNICTLYDVGPNYLVMELVEGQTLAEWIVGPVRRTGPAVDEILGIARQIVNALEAAHEKGIVHRDLKPGNIKVKPDGTVKVLDFGLAKIGETPAASSDESPTLSALQTAQGVILGTAAYMSPEQAKGKTVDKRADIWAFGVVLYEMLTGWQLFTGETVSDTLAAVLKEEPAWEKVPAKARPLLRRCLEKDPKKRLRDIGDAMSLLEGAPESVPAKHPWFAWGIAALAVLIAAVFVYVHFREKAPAAAEKVQYKIIPPISLAPYGSFAVSPNGRYLAFAGLNSNGVPSLWLHDFSTDYAKALPGTESKILPPFFWDPDSRFIAYDSGKRLNKIDISGGLPQKICDTATQVHGGSWNRDGTIIFGSQMGVFRVPAEAGGTPVQLTKLKPGEWADLYPAFLPDGKHFLYFHFLRATETSGICVGSLYAKPEEQAPTQLVSASIGLAYMPSQGPAPGQLIYVDAKEGTLKVQLFDDKQLKKMGNPRTIVSSQVGIFGTYYPFFSASANGRLVYRASVGSLLGRATWFDRQGKPLGAIAESASFAGMSISPDEKQVAICLPNSGAMEPNIWLFDSEGIKPKAVFTYGKNLNSSPIWSPNGDRIIFCMLPRDSNKKAQDYFRLYQKPVNGSKDEEMIGESSANSFPTSWSRDGHFLLYHEYDARTAKSKLCVLSMEGVRKADKFLNTEFSEIDGHFSPDGKWVAYMSDKSGGNEIYVCPFPRTRDGIRVSTDGGMGARWRKDGKELYYRTSDGTIMVVKVTAGETFERAEVLFKAPPDFSEQAILYAFPSWDVTPDGNRFLIPVPVADSAPSPFTVILNWPALLKK